MKIRVLGNFGGVCSGAQLSSFLINDSILLDTVGAAFVLTLEEQVNIKDILITHQHLDSIAGIFFIADNVVSEGRFINVYSIKDVLDSIKKHILNNEIWPDFTKIPSEKAPTLILKEIEEGEVLKLDSLEIIPVRVSHCISCVGFIFRDKNGSVVYSAESSPTNKIWDAARSEKKLNALIIESAFPDSQEELARKSGHLIPKDLPGELEKFGNDDVPVLLHNFKPKFVDEIKRDVNNLGLENIKFMEQNEIYEF